MEKEREKETEGQLASFTADLPPPVAPVEIEYRAAVDATGLLSDDENVHCGLELTSLWTLGRETSLSCSLLGGIKKYN